MDEAEYCHRLAFMHKGAMIALDTPQSLKSKLNLRSMEEVFVNLIDRKESA
jgi:ABC-2 type transport system ATP-binding protein